MLFLSITLFDDVVVFDVKAVALVDFMFNVFLDILFLFEFSPMIMVFVFAVVLMFIVLDSMMLLSAVLSCELIIVF